ncbi:hypothetical protein EGW08_012253 [Elysia chlorotica]|uniref:Notch ligand N-terminal domain-containing protein n=1 Tax=Elysia chlorotica TaxID=188477 RepID=A0A433TEJ2_ELYCH|nr:hypothetical protein EGW08_012253 [Elysia chlorotica]
MISARQTFCWILTVLVLLPREAGASGVLNIRITGFSNPRGYTFDGSCCDSTSRDLSGTCLDQCDYVMRLIVSGLGRANDHVFLFHRPLKYDSNDIAFEAGDSNMVLSVLFDQWPLDGQVKMNAFFYDYDDSDHTTTLVDWFETDLRYGSEVTGSDGVATRGQFRPETVIGNREQDKTVLTFEWAAMCQASAECSLFYPSQDHVTGWARAISHTQPPSGSSLVLAAHTAPTSYHGGLSFSSMGGLDLPGTVTDLDSERLVQGKATRPAGFHQSRRTQAAWPYSDSGEERNVAISQRPAGSMGETRGLDWTEHESSLVTADAVFLPSQDVRSKTSDQFYENRGIKLHPGRKGLYHQLRLKNANRFVRKEKFVPDNLGGENVYSEKPDIDSVSYGRKRHELNEHISKQKTTKEFVKITPEVSSYYVYVDPVKYPETEELYSDPDHTTAQHREHTTPDASESIAPQGDYTELEEYLDDSSLFLQLDALLTQENHLFHTTGKPPQELDVVRISLHDYGVENQQAPHEAARTRPFTVLPPRTTSSQSEVGSVENVESSDGAVAKSLSAYASEIFDRPDSRSTHSELETLLDSVSTKGVVSEIKPTSLKPGVDFSPRHQLTNALTKLKTEMPVERIPNGRKVGSFERKSESNKSRSAKRFHRKTVVNGSSPHNYPLTETPSKQDFKHDYLSGELLPELYNTQSWSTSRARAGFEPTSTDKPPESSSSGKTATRVSTQAVTSPQSQGAGQRTTWRKTLKGGHSDKDLAFESSKILTTTKNVDIYKIRENSEGLTRTIKTPFLGATIGSKYFKTKTSNSALTKTFLSSKPFNTEPSQRVVKAESVTDTNNLAESLPRERFTPQTLTSNFSQALLLSTTTHAPHSMFDSVMVHPQARLQPWQPSRESGGVDAVRVKGPTNTRKAETFPAQDAPSIWQSTKKNNNDFHLIDSLYHEKTNNKRGNIEIKSLNLSENKIFVSSTNRPTHQEASFPVSFTKQRDPTVKESNFTLAVDEYTKEQPSPQQNISTVNTGGPAIRDSQSTRVDAIATREPFSPSHDREWRDTDHRLNTSTDNSGTSRYREVTSPWSPSLPAFENIFGGEKTDDNLLQDIANSARPHRELAKVQNEETNNDGSHGIESTFTDKFLNNEWQYNILNLDVSTASSSVGRNDKFDNNIGTANKTANLMITSNTTQKRVRFLDNYFENKTVPDWALLRNSSQNVIQTNVTNDDQEEFNVPPITVYRSLETFNRTRPVSTATSEKPLSTSRTATGQSMALPSTTDSIETSPKLIDGNFYNLFTATDDVSFESIFRKIQAVSDKIKNVIGNKFHPTRNQKSSELDREFITQLGSRDSVPTLKPNSNSSELSQSTTNQNVYNRVVTVSNIRQKTHNTYVPELTDPGVSISPAATEPASPSISVVTGARPSSAAELPEAYIASIKADDDATVTTHDDGTTCEGDQACKTPRVTSSKNKTEEVTLSSLDLSRKYGDDNMSIIREGIAKLVNLSLGTLVLRGLPNVDRDSTKDQEDPMTFNQTHPETSAEHVPPVRSTTSNISTIGKTNSTHAHFYATTNDSRKEQIFLGNITSDAPWAKSSSTDHEQKQYDLDEQKLLNESLVANKTQGSSRSSPFPVTITESGGSSEHSAQTLDYALFGMDEDGNYVGASGKSMGPKPDPVPWNIHVKTNRLPNRSSPPNEKLLSKSFLPEVSLPENGFILHTKSPTENSQGGQSLFTKSTVREGSSEENRDRNFPQPKDQQANRLPALHIPHTALFTPGPTESAHAGRTNVNPLTVDHNVSLPQPVKRYGSPRASLTDVGQALTRHWPAVLGVTTGTVFLLTALITSMLCRQRRLLVQRSRWVDSPQHLNEPPSVVSEYGTCSATSLSSDLTRSSANLV